MAVSVATILYFLFMCLCLASFTLALCFIVHLHHKHKKLDHIPGPKRDGIFLGKCQRNPGLERQTWIQRSASFESAGPRTWPGDGYLALSSSHCLCYRRLIWPKKYSLLAIIPKMLGLTTSLHTYLERGFLGKGLVTETDHEKWKVKRLALNPAFHKHYLKGLMYQF